MPDLPQQRRRALHWIWYTNAIVHQNCSTLGDLNMACKDAGYA
jgi:hypothetical protein